MNPTEVLSMIWFDPTAFRPTPIFLEIGANSGRVSRELLRRYGGACTAYEPGRVGDKIPTTLPGLTVHRKAVWGKDGTVEFCDLPRQPQSSSVYKRTSKRCEPAPHVVRCVSLTTALKPFKTVDFVNMDAEGAEWDMLMSDHVKSLQKVNQICIEFHTEFSKHTVEEALARMEELAGLRCRIAGTPYKTRPIVWAGRF